MDKLRECCIEWLRKRIKHNETWLCKAKNMSAINSLKEEKEALQFAINNLQSQVSETKAIALNVEKEVKKILDKFATEYEKWLKGQNCLVYGLIQDQARTALHKIYSPYLKAGQVDVVNPEVLSALKRLLHFAEELCEDIKVSKHYPSMENARRVIKKYDAIKDAFEKGE